VLPGNLIVQVVVGRLNACAAVSIKEEEGCASHVSVQLSLQGKCTMDPLDPKGPCIQCKKVGMTAIECGGKALPGRRTGIVKPTQWDKSTARFILENGGEDSKELLAELHRKREVGEDNLVIPNSGVGMETNPTYP
jgi:hypothetical protein